MRAKWIIGLSVLGGLLQIVLIVWLFILAIPYVQAADVKIRNYLEMPKEN